jgi:NAD(P)-dependent dehydrogenase (short-subunit alcohol dehydrogenase family)
VPDTAIIAGFGPGFCEEFAWTLAREGHPVGLFARSEEYTEEFAAELREAGHQALAVPTDVTDPEAVTAGVGRVRDELGPIGVLAHTASTTTGSTGGLDPDRLESMWRLYACGGLLCVRETLDDLRETGGTVLFFGAHPDSGDYAFKSAKDATRGLARALAEREAPDVQVSHVIVAGGLLNPDVYEGDGDVDEETYIDPEGAAETCYHLVEQDPRARTFELDLHTGGRADLQAL